MKNPNAGFSLIEMIVTLALAAILVTMAAPSMHAVTQAGRLTAATNAFVTSLQYARNQALALKDDISVTANAGGWASGWKVKNSAGTTLREYPALASAVSLNSTGGVTTYTYNLAGFMSAPANDTVTLCDVSDKRGRQLTITAVGRIRTNTEYNSCP